MSTSTISSSRSSSSPKAGRRPAPAARDEAFSRIHAQITRRRNAEARARREREQLERLIAETVSSQPLSITWYDHPGLLTREEVLAFGLPRDAAGLHSLMERHRKRQTRT